MKALVLESIGNLIYKEIPTPSPRRGEVLVNVKACGICSSDFDRCLRTGTYRFPTVPGHEFSGVVVSVGPEVDTSVIGNRVVVFPLLPCWKCAQCQIGAYARCQNYSYCGSRCDGGFAEYVCVPVWNIQPFDNRLDYATAALCEPAAVALHAVSTALISPGCRVGIVGTGTIGLLTGLWARNRGAVVSFVARNMPKREFLPAATRSP